jgi:amino acid adenylation domain-containing protein/non-ribosomal peptide synthase protein (TIGR01720 family)
MNKKILHTVLEHVAARGPDRPAVEAGGESVTHGELHRRANRLAHALRAAGAGPDTIVGVPAPPGIDYVVSILGVMKAGAVFLPLDPQTPARRLDHVLSRVKPALFTAPASELRETVALLEPRIPAGAAWTLLTPGAGGTVETRRLGAPPGVTATPWGDADPPPAADEDGGCYVMLTSGSTGDPKAILGSHRGLSHFVHWEVGELGLDEHVRTSLLAPTTFDVSLRDIFVPLLAGGTVCVPDAETRRNGRLLLRWLEESRVTLVHCVPSVLRLLLREMEAEPAPGGRLPAVRHLLSAGEALYGSDAIRWMDATGGRAELLNLYGPSETTLAKLFHRVRERPAEPNAVLPVGRPLPGTAVLILNDAGALCAIGEIGEIHIDTPFRSLGYYGDPGLTRRAFVPNPLAPGSADPVYRTGDLGRYLPDRGVELLGRTDRQVKVNGVRIELAEIEKAAMACEAVDRCVVVDQAHGARETSLACYYTLRRPLSREALREHLAAWLPAAMLPAFFVQMEELPLNLNGKVDRRALPRPEELLYERIPFAPPAGETEERLAALWGERLGLRRVGVNTPFVDLGGSSLDAITLIGRVYQEFGAEVKVRAFFEHSTVRQLAALIGGRTRAAYAPIERTDDADDYPLSPAQRRLWVLQQMDPGSSAYHLPFAFDLAGPLDAAALTAAFTAVIARHESLRTTFTVRDGEPRQRVAPPPPRAPLERIDLRAMSLPRQAGALQRHAREMASAPMDLATGPLLRVRLLQLAPDRHRLLVTLHHIIADGWSLDLLVGELSRGYAAARTGTDPALPPLRIQYRDCAAWQNLLLAGDAAAAQRRFWHERLAGAPALELATDFPRPSVRGGRGATLRARWDAETRGALERCARAANASLFQTLLAGLNVLLYRHTGQADLVVGTPVAERGHPDLEEQVGFYVNTLALRNHVQAGESFASLLSRVAAGALEAFEHQAYPFDRLVEELALERDPGRAPLVEVMLILHNQARGSLSLPGLRVRPLPVRQESSRFDLVLELVESGGGLELEITWDPDLFSAERVGGLAAQLHRLLRAAAADPARGVESLPLLDPAEERALVELGSGPVRDWGVPLTAIGRFEARAEATPGAPAVRAGGIDLTYAQLDARAGDVAAFLAGSGGARGAPVGVAMERGAPQIAAMLGVMKAGCAYLPLDPAHPAERLAWMLRDSGCSLVLTDSGARERVAALSADARLVDLDEVPEGRGGTMEDGGRAPGASDLAYLIYTSGSTGRPKGVMLEHGGFCNVVLDQVERFGIRASDRVLAFASPSFDASLYEVFMGLAAGAAVVVADAETVRDPDRFCAFAEAERVNVMTLPPVYLRALARHPLPTVHTVITAGEAADPGDALHYAATRQYVNAYGPTECSVCACVHRVDAAAAYPGGIPVGRPLANTGVVVLDAAGGLLPPGSEGELCVWGAGLARGYVGAPAGAERSFVDHPAVPGRRLYRTGDRARLRADGCVEFRGRVDEQIKVRGHRVEPGEVRARLLAHPAVRDAVVVARRGATGETEMIAYAVPAVQPAPAEPALRDWVSAALPAHMVPARVVSIDAIPLNRSGKVDREALPEPPGALEAAGRRAPSGSLERLLAEVWEEVLGRRGIGMEESYFSLGGDSIRAIQIVSRLRARGVVLQVRDLLRYPTIGQLALHATVERVPEIGREEDAVGPCPPTPIQRWLLEQYGERSSHFNQPVLLRAAEPVDSGALRAALAALHRHHDALRTVFEVEGGTFRPRVLDPDRPVDYATVDLSGHPDPRDALARHAAAVQGGLDLREGPLFRAVLYRADEGDFVFLLAHHLVVDGVSWRILLEDLETAYSAARHGREIVLPPKTAPFRSWAERLQAYAASPALLAQREYWAGVEAAGRALPPLPRDPVPDGPPPAEPIRAAASLTADETAALLTTVHQAYNTEINDLLLTALARALAGWHGGARTLVALEGHGREAIGGDGMDVGRTVGWFTSVHPVVLDADGTDPGAQLKRTREMLRGVPARGIGYGVLRHLSPADASAPRLGTVRPEIGFNYLGQFHAGPAAAFALSADPTGPSRAPDVPPVYAVEIDAAVEDGVFSLSVACDPHRYGSATAQALARSIAAELRTVIAHCLGRDTAEPTPGDLDFDGLDASDLDRILASLGWAAA